MKYGMQFRFEVLISIRMNGNRNREASIKNEKNWNIMKNGKSEELHFNRINFLCSVCALIQIHDVMKPAEQLLLVAG